jgi:hypothetical protein
MGPLNANHPVLGFLAGGAPVNDAVVQANQGADDEPQPNAADSASQGTEQNPTANAANTSPAATVEPESSGRTDVAPHPPQPPEDDEPVAASAETTPAANVAPEAGTVADAASSETNTPSELASSPTTDAPIPAPILAEASETTTSEVAAAPPVPDLGRYISENEVLARFDGTANAWMRLPTNEPLGYGDQVLALPAYRPKLVLASGFQITLSGGTLLELRPPEAPGTANLALEYGRIVVVPVVAAAGGVRLDCWGRQGKVTFSPESIMAVQLRRYRAPGVDPEAGLAHRMVEIYALGGNLVWNEPGHPEQTIKAGETFAFLDDARGGVVPTEVVPPWVESNDVERTDELASQDVQAAIGYELPLSRSLLELVAHRKVEVCALAARSLAYLDVFDPLVDAINDEKQKSYWDDHFNELQRALARDPRTAQEIRVTLEKIRGRPAATELYRLLWSYSPEDLAGGAAERLVEHLMSGSLDVRVLAIQNLERITGMTHLYRPEVEDARRKTAYQRWRNSLAEGKIKYNEMLLMLPPRAMPEEFPEEPDAANGEGAGGPGATE